MKVNSSCFLLMMVWKIYINRKTIIERVTKEARRRTRTKGVRYRRGA